MFIFTFTFFEKGYCPFGMLMPGRSYLDSSFRFGFNGMEKFNEADGVGNSYVTEFRELNPRLGSWWSIDPVAKPWESPYSGLLDNPLLWVDPYGLDPIGNGERHGKIRNPNFNPKHHPYHRGTSGYKHGGTPKSGSGHDRTRSYNVVFYETVKIPEFSSKAVESGRFWTPAPADIQTHIPTSIFDRWTLQRNDNHSGDDGWYHTSFTDAKKANTRVNFSAYANKNPGTLPYGDDYIYASPNDLFTDDISVDARSRSLLATVPLGTFGIPQWKKAHYFNKTPKSTLPQIYKLYYQQNIK